MGLLNPVHALTIPSVLLITIPLAIFAGITATLAFSVLIFRVLVVYLDLAFSLVPQSLPGLRSQSATTQRVPSSTSAAAAASGSSPTRRQFHHRRRRSSASGFSGGSTSSLGERGLGLIPSVGAERDFEGVGGWRVGGEEDDELWSNVNLKLDMPERSPLIGTTVRQHHRTPSGGATTPGEGGYLMMKGRAHSPEAGGMATVRASTSPNSSRARTPTGPRLTFTTGVGQIDGYFAPRNASPRETKKA